MLYAHEPASRCRFPAPQGQAALTRPPQEGTTRRKTATSSRTPASKTKTATTATTETAKAASKPRARKPVEPEAQTETLPPYASPSLNAIRRAIEDMKAEEVVEIDLRGKTSLGDMMIVATGRSNRHVVSIAERIVEFLKADGCPTPRLEGLPHGDWVLIDGFDVIVHLFRPEVRAFYNLEKMWGIDRPAEGDDSARRTG